jgi:hypothetical protein
MIVVNLSSLEAEVLLGFVGELLDNDKITELARECLDTAYIQLATQLTMKDV